MPDSKWNGRQICESKQFYWNWSIENMRNTYSQSWWLNELLVLFFWKKVDSTQCLRWKKLNEMELSTANILLFENSNKFLAMFVVWNTGTFVSRPCTIVLWTICLMQMSKMLDFEWFLSVNKNGFFVHQKTIEICQAIAVW